MHKPLLSKFYVILPFLLSLGFAACKKEKKATVYDFSYSGSSYIGNTVHFKTTPYPDGKSAWDFGDNTSAAVANPDHIYTVAGSYTVSLVLDGDTAHTIKKTLKIGADSLIMAGLMTTRVYKYFSTWTSNGGPSIIIHDTMSYMDTLISVTMVDPATILFSKENFYVTSFDGTLLKFEHSFDDYSGFSPGPHVNYKYLSFYLSTNEVHYKYTVSAKLASGYVPVTYHMDSK